MRYLIRQAHHKDITEILSLAKRFSLCKNTKKKDQLEKKIQTSQESFDKTLNPFYRNYIFVLEDTKEKKVIGSSQILSYFGPNRSYCYILEKKKNTIYLKIKQIKRGRHQLGGLILHPQYRKSKELLGIQIGFVRFLYMQSFPEDFSTKIEVSLTAPIKKTDNPFWKETGATFFKKKFSVALEIFQKDRIEFFKIFPKNFQIKLKNLSPSARRCLKMVHPQTFPVYKGLIKRGFYKSPHHDLLDGGIYLEANWKNLFFLKEIQKLKLQFKSARKTEDYLIAQQTKKGFRCVKLKAKKIRNILLLRKNKFLEKDKKAIFLKFPF
ncbi:MAG: arginine N-succinyltransferase [Bdellovibrionaceae bacterium]|nr:arginine N-succinyltransferase [Pseudobdellovibrionaceae bacterium]